LDQKYLQKSQK
jgi:hypothetical protein